MLQRICPVCDQVMKHAHYCSACQSWVKDPVYMDVTYYLNERHPKNEAHCSYHNREQEHTNKRVQAGQRTGAGTEVQTKPTGKKANPGRKLLLLYIVIMVLIWIMKAVSGLAGSFLTVTSHVFDRVNGADYRELSDKEAGDYGGPCTDEAHFAVTMEDLQRPLQELIDAYPIPVTGTDSYSHNTVYSDQSTWFSSTNTYFIEAEDGLAYVDFDYDTATGQLHQIYLSIPDRGFITDLTKQFLLLLNDADAWDSGQNLRSDEVDLDELYDEMMDPGMEQVEGVWRGAGFSAEFPAAENDNCRVWIYPDRSSGSYGEDSESTL